MVLPLIAAGLTTAGNIAGGVMGANAQEGANKTNQLINIMNAMMRNQERIDAIEMAGKQRREDKLGGIDASGNRTYFDPDRGWVVEGGTDAAREGNARSVIAQGRNMDESVKGFLRDAMARDATAGTNYMKAVDSADNYTRDKEIGELQDREQLNTLHKDLPMRRKQLEANYVDQLQDREQEQKYINELQYSKVDPSSIRSMLFQDAQKGIEGSFDEATSAALRGSIRQGGSGSADILSKMARERSAATGDAFSKTGAQSLQLADSMSKSNAGQIQNLINFFGGRARGLPAVNYSKENTPQATIANAPGMNTTGSSGEMNNLMKMFLSASQNSEGMPIAAAGKQGGTVDYITPNLGFANTVAQAGQGLGNLFKAFDANNRNSDATKRFNASNSYG